MIKNRHFKVYFDSFKLNKKFFYPLLIDIIIFIILSLLVVGLSTYLQYKADSLSNGKDSESIKKEMLNSPPQKLENFLIQMRSFLILFFVSISSLLIISLLLFTFSRYWVWKILLNLKFHSKTFWRWCLFNIILFLFICIFLLFSLFFNLIFSYILSSIFPVLNVAFYFNKSVNYLSILLLFFFMFLWIYSFCHKFKIWESFGEAFSLIKRKWALLWKAFLFVMVTAIIVAVVQYPLTYFFSEMVYLIGFISAIFSFLFLAWFRVYMLRVMELE